jgi:hypothetical protein
MIIICLAARIRWSDLDQFRVDDLVNNPHSTIGGIVAGVQVLIAAGVLLFR